jgi:hypothetical protein
MTDTNDYDEFRARRYRSRRRLITGGDWKIPELRNATPGSFVPHPRKIAETAGTER